ncbi:MAG: diacylglycerol kinase family protein [Chitinophagales bacterium]
MKKKLRFIINPIAGTRYKNLRPKAIEKFIDREQFDFDIAYTERQGHAEELAAKAAEEGIDIVAIAGGDGSVNEAARGLKYSKTALAIIPIGSGNGVARKLNIPLKPYKALQLINTGKILLMDGGSVNDEFFLMSPGLGFDAAMLQNFDKFKMRGVWGYLKSLFQTSKTFKAFDVVLNLDGKEIKERVYSILLSNIGQLGYGINFDKTSKVDDGYLELVTMKEFPKWKILWYILVAFFLNPAKASIISIYKFKQMTGVISAKQCLQIDGDYKKEVESIKANVVEKVVNVIVPSNYN